MTNVLKKLKILQCLKRHSCKNIMHVHWKHENVFKNCANVKSSSTKKQNII